MYKRKTLTLLLVFALVFSYAVGVYAAADKADAAYLRDLKKVEDYLNKHHDEPHLGEKAGDYIRKNLKDMNLQRLEANLRSFLRCGPGVPLPNMLDAYTREMRGDYKSICERAAEYGISPEAAADENSYNRAALGAKIGTRSGRDSEAPEVEWRTVYCGGLSRDGEMECEVCVTY